MAYLPPLTFTSVSAPWTQPQRLATPSTRRGTILGLGIKASTSSVSQVLIQVGYGYRVSAASARIEWVVSPVNAPPTAGGWNTSSTSLSAAVFQDSRTWTDAPGRFDFNTLSGAPWCYSAAGGLNLSAGVWVRMRAANSGAAANFTTYFDNGAL